jgi:predicted regulator of Ras-like GTPase activity (Roadblock/LC7/MglB family)
LPSGAVTLPFGELREAAPQLFTGGSDCDGLEIALPLNEILARINVAVIARPQARSTPAVPEEITSPFEGLGPKPIPAPVPAAPALAPLTFQTETVDHGTTPNEIVSRAAALNGVAGALVALPDGLMVASKLSPGLNGETLAAFLPQIFSRITRSTKELGVGEVNNLNFTVDNVPWRISVVNSIFFAAFGCSGQPLPTTQLSALAEELEHNQG